MADNTRRILRSRKWETEPIRTQARIVLESDGEPMQISDGESWSVEVFDVDTGEQLYSLLNQHPSGVISDSLQTWDEDSTGCNFDHTLALAAFIRQGGHTIRAEYVVESVSEGAIPMAHHAFLIPQWGHDG